MAKKEGICDICGCEHQAYSSAYSKEPFIDGRHHREICWACACVPKMYEFFEQYDDGKAIFKDHLVVYNEFDPRRLHTVQEMMADGFDRDEAIRSIKAVKQAIKNPTIKKNNTMSNRRRRKRRHRGRNKNKATHTPQPPQNTQIRVINGSSKVGTTGLPLSQKALKKAHKKARKLAERNHTFLVQEVFIREIIDADTT